MPNDVVLDPTVHHLFAKNQFNRGKSSRLWPLYPRCGHDLSPPRCPPFVEAGTPDLLWLYKSQRKAWKKGGILEEKPRKTEHTKHNPKKIQSQERKTRAKTKAKTPEQRNNTQREGEERNPVYTENCSRYCLHLCRRPCIKKTQHKTQIPNWKEKPAPSSVHHHKDWESKEKQRKKRGQWA